MNWRFCVVDPQERALALCRGSMDKGAGFGSGDGWGNGGGWGNGYGSGYGRADGDGRGFGDGYGYSYGDVMAKSMTISIIVLKKK